MLYIFWQPLANSYARAEASSQMSHLKCYDVSRSLFALETYFIINQTCLSLVLTLLCWIPSPRQSADRKTITEWFFHNNSNNNKHNNNRVNSPWETCSILPSFKLNTTWVVQWSTPTHQPKQKKGLTLWTVWFVLYVRTYAITWNNEPLFKLEVWFVLGRGSI